MADEHKTPNEATPTKLFWYRNGPWKRTVATRDVLTHDFPAPHSDYLTQVIDYHVPPEKVSDLTRFDGSCLVDRTAGEVAARCDSEDANAITLNLMREIVTGQKSVEEAREAFAQSMAAYAMGKESEYVEQFVFDLPQEEAEDIDESNMAEEVAEKLGVQARGLLGSDR